MALVSLDGHFVRVNRAFCDVVGHDPAELSNLTFETSPTPRTATSIVHSAEQLARGEIPRYRLEKRYIRKDADRRRHHVQRVAVFMSPPARPLYYVAQIQDITERKRVEKQLRDANVFLDAIIENVPLMLFIKDSESLRFVRVNRAGEDLLGWPREALVRKDDFDFGPGNRPSSLSERSGDPEDRPGGHRPGTDTDAPSWRSRPVHEEGSDPRSVGNPLYLLGISEDITERRRMEQQRRLLAEGQRGAVCLARLRADLGDRERIGRSKRR
jgi:PAS domain S-box-containing protein